MGVLVADVKSIYEAVGVVVITPLSGEGCVGGDILELQLVREVGPLCVNIGRGNVLGA